MTSSRSSFRLAEWARYRSRGNMINISRERDPRIPRKEKQELRMINNERQERFITWVTLAIPATAAEMTLQVEASYVCLLQLPESQNQDRSSIQQAGCKSGNQSYQRLAVAVAQLISWSFKQCGCQTQGPAKPLQRSRASEW
ncbi:Hypothetical predicted protein [Xyrichtys novacula]|uniref:Uncharacterized protein n=1 Tax=Xyrichtys novacula TaxID=13765 RepID=A0AAV1HF39_XYRNO|nr:Hypothetical predicted protein [Xyrichtys novacula]